MGLRLALVSKQKTELIDIERYFTLLEKYVNGFEGKWSFQSRK